MRYLDIHCKKCGVNGDRKLNKILFQGHTKKGFTYEIYIDEEDGTNE